MPLRIAASEGHLEVMLALLEAGAEANAMRSGALGAAAFQGYLEIVDVLLKAGADSTAIANVDLEPLAALVRAARDGEIEEVKSLIHSGADVNEESSNGWTPLILDFGHFLNN